MEGLTEEKRALLQGTPRLRQLQYVNPEGGTSQRGVRVIEEVSYKWESLALSLHFKEHIIQIITANHPKNCEAACCDMFRRWLQGRNDTREPVSWETLIRSLYETGTFKALGNKLVKVLCEMRSGYVTHSSQTPPNGDLPHDVEDDGGPVLKEGKRCELAKQALPCQSS